MERLPVPENIDALPPDRQSILARSLAEDNAEPINKLIGDYKQELQKSYPGRDYMGNAVIILGHLKGRRKELDSSSSSRLKDFYEEGMPAYTYAQLETIVSGTIIKQDDSALWYKFNTHRIHGKERKKNIAELYPMSGLVMDYELLSEYSSPDFTAMHTFLSLFAGPRADFNDCPLGSVGLDDLLRNFVSSNAWLDLQLSREGIINFSLRDEVDEHGRECYNDRFENVIQGEEFYSVMNHTPSEDNSYKINLFMSKSS